MKLLMEIFGHYLVIWSFVIYVIYVIRHPVIRHSSFFVVRHSSFVIRHSSSVIRHPSFVIRHSSFVIRHSPFAIRHSPFAIRHSSFVIRHSSFVIRHSSFVIRHCLRRFVKEPVGRPRRDSTFVPHVGLSLD
jgi:hypothetical protein